MSLADLNFGSSEEENAELKKLNAEVLEDTDSFDNWEKLLRAAEGFEGGLNRNSSPQAIVAARDIYDRFLAKFPLLFGYWKKYADLEFSIAGTEAAELTFERGAGCVGLDFLAHPFWDKYIEFEERAEAQDKIFSILDRVIHIPMHQYARYFERFRHLAQSRPLSELVPAQLLTQFQDEVEKAGASDGGSAGSERALRTRIDGYHLELFHRTQTETTRRWTYESEIKRPYFHITELDEGQLTNWRKYLDFEEVEGDYARASFLYERCLVTCALYDEFWLRYARWMFAQQNKEEEVRHIYQRASCFYVPIARPAVRLQYAYFEESLGYVELAKDIHEAILVNLPGHLETIISLSNLSRRHEGLDAAIQLFKSHIDAPQSDASTKASLVAEWARLLWKIKGSAEESRQVFQQSYQSYLVSPTFWKNYLEFEMDQSSSSDSGDTQYTKIKQVHEDIRNKTHLPPESIKDLSHTYMKYLQERGGKGAAKEYMQLDQEVNGPASVRSAAKAKAAQESKEAAGQPPNLPENGQPPVPDPAAVGFST